MGSPRAPVSAVSLEDGGGVERCLAERELEGVWVGLRRGCGAFEERGEGGADGVFVEPGVGAEAVRGRVGVVGVAVRGGGEGCEVTERDARLEAGGDDDRRCGELRSSAPRDLLSKGGISNLRFLQRGDL